MKKWKFLGKKLAGMELLSTVALWRVHANFEFFCAVKNGVIWTVIFMIVEILKFGVENFK